MARPGVLQLCAASTLMLVAPIQMNAAERIEEEGKPGNFVGEHRFSPSFFILTPFSTPSVTTGLLVGVMHPSVPELNEDLDIVGFSPTLQAQIPIIKKLTIPIRITGLALAGIDAISALNYGATAGYRLEAGAQYQFIDSPDIALSGAFTVGKPHLYAVSPLVSAREAIQNQLQGAPSELNSITEATEWFPSARAAYSINASIGLQGSLGVQFFSNADLQESHSKLAFALGLDFQFKPELKIPLALSAIYGRNQVLTKAGAQNTNTYAFSLFETFSQRFNFGGEAGWISTSNDTVFSFGIIGRYYY